MTVIVAGWVVVDPRDRDRYVLGHQGIPEAARAFPGCLDVSISADPLEAGRVNIFEHWETHEALEAFRAQAPSPTVDGIEMTDVQVLKHEVAHSGPPFD